MDMSALLNSAGGTILLGVNDDLTVSGLVRDRRQTEEWVMNIAQTNIQPSVIPIWSTVAVDEGVLVGVIELMGDSPGKPYKARRSGSWGTFVRVGSTSRAATREEEARLYQAAQILHYEVKTVPRTDLSYLDMARVENYFRNILRREVPNIEDHVSWRRHLLNSDLVDYVDETYIPTVAGLLLFGYEPNRRLPQSGITAAAFPGESKDYNTIDEERIKGPVVPMVSPKGDVVERGVIERAVDFVNRNMGSEAWLEGARRMRKGAFPLEAVREAIVNAVVHRDYTREGTDIEISLYADRLEVISPGKLPNGVTVDKLKEGVVRVARNGLIKEILRDYRYIEHMGMGVRNRIIEAMTAHNGTEPDLIDRDDRFLVRLWKR